MKKKTTEGKERETNWDNNNAEKEMREMLLIVVSSHAIEAIDAVECIFRSDWLLYCTAESRHRVPDIEISLSRAPSLRLASHANANKVDCSNSILWRIGGVVSSKNVLCHGCHRVYSPPNSFKWHFRCRRISNAISDQYICNHIPTSYAIRNIYTDDRRPVLFAAVIIPLIHLYLYV